VVGGILLEYCGVGDVFDVVAVFESYCLSSVVIYAFWDNCFSTVFVSMDVIFGAPGKAQ
jgi:uncharacterized membrane protein